MYELPYRMLPSPKVFTVKEYTKRVLLFSNDLWAAVLSRSCSVINWNVDLAIQYIIIYSRYYSHLTTSYTCDSRSSDTPPFCDH